MIRAMSLVVASVSESVGVIRLNRPEALNALSRKLMDELIQALKAFDDDSEVRAIVLCGSERVFCAGADIKELRELTFVEAYMKNFLQDLNDAVTTTRKPIIAAVSGYALGGGCELAMMCDIIYAAANASFGQPEVRIGTIPGAGGTQRLIRAVGKAKAMELVLTGDSLSALEAEKAGLVAKVLQPEEVLHEAINLARRIGRLSSPVVIMAKEAVNQAEEMSLRDGLLYERRLYHASFGLEDSTEGMDAFIKKRSAQWKDK